MKPPEHSPPGTAPALAHAALRVIPNFRDCGGYASRYGGRVATGVLFRSGQCPPQAAGLPDLLALDFSLIVDLRFPGERARSPSPWPSAWQARVLAHNDETGGEAPHLALLSTPGLQAAAADELFARLYGALPLGPPYMPLFAEALTRCATTQGPVLVHCTAGKDRTGMFTALLQTILGMTQTDIETEYMRSLGAPGLAGTEHAVAAAAQQRFGHPPAPALITKLLGVQPAYLAAMFAAIIGRFGTMERYFDEIGVNAATRARLREAYLAP